jgi:hypothetical protein
LKVNTSSNLENHLRHILAMYMLNAFFQYNLILGLRLMRSMGYMGIRKSVIRKILNISQMTILFEYKGVEAAKTTTTIKDIHTSSSYN